MPDNAAQLYKSGAISTAAYNKIAAQTRHQKSKMTDFEEGTRDEGMNRNKGQRGVASNRHIDQNQRVSPKALSGGAAAGPPSRGGFVQNDGAQPRSRQIDQAPMQKPTFPAGARVKKANARGGNKRAKGRIPARGGQYGGGGQGTQ